MKTWVEISHENILHNIKSLRSLLQPGALFMAMLKANAYGHGLEVVSKICIQSKEVDWFGVDSIDEAMALRNFGVSQPILILGYVPFDRIMEVIKNDISFVAYNKELLDYLALQKFPKSKKAKIHIKVETGTARQGIEGEELLEFVKCASKNKNILIEGIYTHYANIEDTTDPSYAMDQLKRFNENVGAAEKIVKIPLKHSACSAAVINFPETHFNMVRAGISLYGMWPSTEAKAVAKQKEINLVLKPALTWQTQIAQIKKVSANIPISYGLTETVKRDSVIGILPVGYWDGYDRGLSGVGEVLINGQRAKILGRICMNMMIVDLTDIKEYNLFNGVVLLGPSGKDYISAEELAKKINTINYEITTRINPLIKRVII
ncbi:MAG: alanine racemase [Patescibacteria group bacterium]